MLSRMPGNLTIFLAGIIQGSLPDAIHPQEYRREIAALILADAVLSLALGLTRQS